VTWNVESSEDNKLAASVVGSTCLRERIGKQRKQPLILHAVTAKEAACHRRLLPMPEEIKQYFSDPRQTLPTLGSPLKRHDQDGILVKRQ